jgi:hypothetical protein
VPFTFADGWIQLAAVNFANTQTQVFAIRRASLLDGIPAWWSEKLTYWKRPAVAPATDRPREAGSLGTLKIDTWRFLADRDGVVSAKDGWQGAGFDDRAWENLSTGPWTSLKPELKDYAGIGLYRTAFTLPAGWKGSSISLNLYGDRSPNIFGKAEFFLNGQRIAGPAFDADLMRAGSPARIVIDGQLVPGPNLLAVRISDGAEVGRERFAGFGGSVYLAAEAPLTPAIDLASPWSLVQADGSTTEVPFPVTMATGACLAKEVAIPASWAGRGIWLRLETTTPWIEGLMVNGKLLLPARFRRMGSNVEWNISPWVEAGRTARIELWGRALPLFSAVDQAKAAVAMDLLSARIGCLP